MFSRRFAVVAAFGLVFSPALRAGHRLGAEQQAQVSAWLASHPEYRLATDKDCACDEDLHTMRTTGYGGKWKPVPDYHPYVATGDFNGDGKLDLAVAVIQVTIPHKFTILVFNGPIHDPPRKTPPREVGNFDLRGSICARLAGTIAVNVTQVMVSSKRLETEA